MHLEILDTGARLLENFGLNKGRERNAAQPISQLVVAQRATFLNELQHAESEGEEIAYPLRDAAASKEARSLVSQNDIVLLRLPAHKYVGQPFTEEGIYIYGVTLNDPQKTEDGWRFVVLGQINPDKSVLIEPRYQRDVIAAQTISDRQTLFEDIKAFAAQHAETAASIYVACGGNKQLNHFRMLAGAVRTGSTAENTVVRLTGGDPSHLGSATHIAQGEINGVVKKGSDTSLVSLTLPAHDPTRVATDFLSSLVSLDSVPDLEIVFSRDSIDPAGLQKNTFRLLRPDERSIAHAELLIAGGIALHEKKDAHGRRAVDRLGVLADKRSL